MLEGGIGSREAFLFFASYEKFDRERNVYSVLSRLQREGHAPKLLAAVELDDSAVRIAGPDKTLTLGVPGALLEYLDAGRLDELHKSAIPPEQWPGIAVAGLRALCYQLCRGVFNADVVARGWLVSKDDARPVMYDFDQIERSSSIHHNWWQRLGSAQIHDFRRIFERLAKHGCPRSLGMKMGPGQRLERSCRASGAHARSVVERRNDFARGPRIDVSALAAPAR